MQCEGTKFDIELNKKEIVFGRTLLYRCQSQFLTIRNKTPVAFIWSLESEEPHEFQIAYVPSNGVIDPRTDMEIEFYYQAITVLYTLSNKLKIRRAEFVGGIFNSLA